MSAQDFDLTSCIHCGLCLMACPTYRVLGDEAESPRGRLRLMAEAPGTALDFAALDHCLACRGCESVCPSGVPYAAHLQRARERRPPRRRWRWWVDHVLSRPAVLAPAVRLAMVARRFGLRRVLPAPLRGGLDLLPECLPARSGLPATSGSVAILPGCAQSVLQPDLLPALMRLVRAVGEEPFVPRSIACCGALSAHQGSHAQARVYAIELVQCCRDVPQLIVPSAGCSAHIRELPELLAGTPWEQPARELTARTQDAVSWLADRAERFRFSAHAGSVAYHPPCHHSHAQGIRGQAERLLAEVPGLRLLQPAEPERCCGSAGSYSLEEPRLAARIRSAKWEDLRAAAPELVLSANPGCELFLAAGRLPGDPKVDSLYRFLAARLGREPGNR